MDPFEEITFYGETDKQNPMIFLRQFEDTVSYKEIPREQQLYNFKRVLKGGAKHWIEAMNPPDIETAKSLFKEILSTGRERPEKFLSVIYTADIINPEGERACQNTLLI